MSTSIKEELVFERRVQAQLEEVYGAWTRGWMLRGWLSDGATVGKQPGERYILWWNAGNTSAGTLVGATPPTKLSFTWNTVADPGITQVDVLLTEEGDHTAVSVRHGAIGEGKEWETFRQETAAFWPRALENLQALLETGEDLRFLRRPLLGISIGEYSPEIAEQLGIAGTPGVRLDGVAEGGGAERAHLRANDVLVEMAGAPITGWPSLVTALSSHQAGDSVEVAYMRLGERRTTTLTLGKRTLTDVTDRSTVLRRLAEGYSAAYAAVSDLLADVPAELALKRPGPDEWSALEVVAHLILVEREIHAVIGDLLNEDERWSDENPTNVLARVAAMAAAYPASEAMLGALQNAFTETQALMAALPDTYAQRASAWTRTARMVLDSMNHTHEHSDQLRKALRAAR